MFLNTFVLVSIRGNMTRNLFCQNASLHLPLCRICLTSCTQITSEQTLWGLVNEGEEKCWHAVVSTGFSLPVPISISQCEGYHPAPGVLINAFCTGQQEAVRMLESKCCLLCFCYIRCSFLDWHQLLGGKHRPAHRYSQPIFILFFSFKYHPSPLQSPSLVHCDYLDVFCSSLWEKKKKNKTALCYCYPAGLSSQTHSRERVRG